VGRRRHGGPDRHLRRRRRHHRRQRPRPRRRPPPRQRPPPVHPARLTAGKEVRGKRKEGGATFVLFPLRSFLFAPSHTSSGLIARGFGTARTMPIERS
jgi:hypothetical protein